jgi:pyridoxine kinase
MQVCAVIGRVLSFRSDRLNFTGYRRHGGTKTTAAELAEMFHSMKQNEMIIAGRLLTGVPTCLLLSSLTKLITRHCLGFVPDADCLSEISQLATELRKTNPNLIYLLDRMFYFL